ncbi:hypothetical protein [Zavarzinella formosa]|uniref:hypothetical protein n=1 Tax=Zavarzinella formosa TaxID=360055 RepID=UPI0002E3F02F|nr:hypothetical protein [Zavarzinella formosa]
MPGQTAIVLHGVSFLTVWENRNQYFLSDKEHCLHGSPYVDAFGRGSHNHAVFYRGIKVHDARLPALFRYNRRDKVTLTEDRTLKYSFHMNEAIEKSVITSQDQNFIMKVLTAGEFFHEGQLTFVEQYPSLEMSDSFRAVCRKLNERRPRGLNMGAIRWYQNRTQSSQPLTPAKLTNVQQKQLDKAMAFVGKIGFGDDLERYPASVVNWLGDGVYGMAKDGTILLAKDIFDKGTKFLASTIIEEFVHNHYDLRDVSRELQTWLFDRLVTMGEEYVTGESL